MTKAQIADALRRAIRTFVQAAGAYLVAAPNHDVDKALIVGAVGAGLAAVWRMVDPADSKPEPGPTPELESVEGGNSAVSTASSKRKTPSNITAQL